MLKYIDLAAEFLDLASDQLSNNGCNDWRWPEGWTLKDKKKLMRDYHKWNGDPKELREYEEESYEDKIAPLPDWAVAAFLAYKIRGID